MSASSKKLVTIAVISLMVSAAVVYASNRVPSVRNVIG